MMMNKLKISVLAAMMVLAWAVFAFAAATPEEAAQLGKNLTLFGAEAAGNKDGSIPAYTGGLKTPPANYVAMSGWRPDPFASEKPLFSINAQNMAQYADKLTVGQKYLLQKNPTSMRMDVYKTHRTAWYPDWLLKNTVKLATKVALSADGNDVSNASACVMFPIPKNGAEAIWNHCFHYQGIYRKNRQSSIMVDSTGTPYFISSMHFLERWPYYEEGYDSKKTPVGFTDRWIFDAPARKAGEGGMARDPLSYANNKRTAYLYLPGQRRVKLAPQVNFDTPSSDGNGNWTYDETWMFNGSLERYDWKLIGKKEMYVPYNCYKLAYPIDDKGIFTKNHVNPDMLRFELHRVWIVEATLKPGARHIYKKRVFYIDEDSWTAIWQDIYDNADKLYKVDYNVTCQNYETGDLGAFFAEAFIVYNLNNGACLFGYPAFKSNGGYHIHDVKRPESEWAPDQLMTANIR